MRNTLTTIEPRGAEATIEEGRVTLDAKSNDVALRVQVPERRPLGASEEVLRLAVSGPGFATEIELSSHDLDALADAIHGVQSGEVWDGE